ncbi:hypothetical protein BK816_00335 [Boudabousia tangfeifanii]|uniref:Uncharacterized protein n=1 Tax=Boudabousia tangfeifanii TaxID=1912795 RepID=A0A1D9MI08_9ACTO|nr:hypothetical protein [Boudabousia tangfeifanii]AOZ71927.1 hypothetical protein BK816_00335 [Boudabousia tangfeifanii]
MNLVNVESAFDIIGAAGFVVPVLAILAWFAFRRLTLGRPVPSYEFRQTSATVITPGVALIFAGLSGAIMFGVGTMPDEAGAGYDRGFGFTYNQGMLFLMASAWVGLVGLYLADRLLFETVFRNHTGGQRMADLQERKPTDLLPPGGLVVMAGFTVLATAGFALLQSMLPDTAGVLVSVWVYFLVTLALAAAACFYALHHLANRLPYVSLNPRGDLAARRMTALRYAIGWVWGCAFVLLSVFQAMYSMKLATWTATAMIATMVLALAASVWLFLQARRVGGGRVSAHLEDVLEKDYSGVRTEDGRLLKEQSVFARMEAIDMSHGMTTLFGDAGGPGFGDFPEDGDDEPQAKRRSKDQKNDGRKRNDDEPVVDKFDNRTVLAEDGTYRTEGEGEADEAEIESQARK